MNEKTIVKVSAGVFHNRVTLNDSIAARRQSAVPAAGQRQQRLSGQPGRRGGAASLPLGMTAIDPVFKHPTAYMWSAGVQREMPLGFVARRRPTSAARASTCSASATSTSCCPARSRRTRRQHRRAAAVSRATASSACRRTPATRTTTACRSARSAATRTASSSARPTRSATRRTTPATSATSCSTPTTTPGFWGNSSFDRRHVFNFYYIYDLPFYREQTRT